MATGALHLQRKVEVGDRLDHKVERAHLVPLDGVLGHVGDEDERGVAVDGAQPLRRLEPVHMRHFDIHQDDIAAARILADKFKPVRICFDRIRAARLGKVALDELLQPMRARRLVFYNDHVHHKPILPCLMLRLYHARAALSIPSVKCRPPAPPMPRARRPSINFAARQ